MPSPLNDLRRFETATGDRPRDLLASVTSGTSLIWLRNIIALRRRYLEYYTFVNALRCGMRPFTRRRFPDTIPT
jgi:hypothetical protein